MSDSIYQESVSNALEWAGAQEVEWLRRFLTEQPEVPLIAVGSGGSYSVAHYAALLYGTRSAVGRSLTPLSANSLSDAALLGCKVLLVSAKGNNSDIVFLCDRLMRLGHHRVANLSVKDGEDNKLKKKIPAQSSFNYSGVFMSKFIELDSVVAQYSLICRAFGGFLPTAAMQRPYYYCRKDGGNAVLPMDRVRHLVVLYADYAEPVAMDLESKMVESGLAGVQMSDYRNFCHGRFSFVGNHCGRKSDYMETCDTAVVILSTAHLKTVAEKVRTVLPDWCPVVSVATEQLGPAAGIDLLVRASLFFADFSLAKGVKDPVDPPCPNIDKSRVQSKVSFSNDLKREGPLGLKG